MQRAQSWRRAAVAICLLASLGASPATPSYVGVSEAIDSLKAEWARPGNAPDVNAPGWNAIFDAINGELKAYTSAEQSEARGASLGRLAYMSAALRGVAWEPSNRIQAALDAWLQPRLRLAEAERSILSVVQASVQADPSAKANGDGWIRFVDNELANSLKAYEEAPTVSARRQAFARLKLGLEAIRGGNRTRPWAPSLELEQALGGLWSRPNIDITADVPTLHPLLAVNLVQSGPVYRKGYWSQVTAGPYLGFQLLPSDDGIAFTNSQSLSSVTPITDFQNQLEQDRKGRKVAKLYHVDATSYSAPTLTVMVIVRPSGLQIVPSYQHAVGASIATTPQPGKGFGRAVASLIGFNQGRVTQEIYNNAIPEIQQNVVKESTEETNERTGKEAAQRNAALSKFLVGNNTLALGNVLVTGLDLRSRPQFALIGGKLVWKDFPSSVGAESAQPSKFANPDSGITADVHLGSILNNLADGYLVSDQAKAVENLVIETRKVPPGTTPRDGVKVRTNVDFNAYHEAVVAAKALNDPASMAIRVKKPSKPPEFEADAKGNLVALVHDFQLEVPAPPQAARGGGLIGPPAQIYRIVSPQAEFAISVRVAPETPDSPLRLTGRIEEFDPGQGTKIFAINEDEAKAVPLTALTTNIVLAAARVKIQGQPIDLPLSNLPLRGFVIREVSPLDPTGWMRLVLARDPNASANPAIQGSANPPIASAAPVPQPAAAATPPPLATDPQASPNPGAPTETQPATPGTPPIPNPSIPQPGTR
jgi:hypothetical protein